MLYGIAGQKYIVRLANQLLASWLSKHGLTGYFNDIFVGHSYEWVNTYGPKFKEFISYVYYFIPKSYLQPFFTLVITMISVRVIFAIFRVITDLL